MKYNICNYTIDIDLTGPEFGMTTEQIEEMEKRFEEIAISGSSF